MTGDFGPFTPHRTRREDEPLEARLRVLEDALTRVQSRLQSNPDGGVSVAGEEGTGGGSGGGGGGGMDGYTLPHALLSPEHSDTTPSTPPTDGDLVTASGSLWQRLAIGTETYALKVVSGLVAWAQVAFSELTGSLSAAQHGTLGSGADHTADLSANARVNVKKAGASVGIRRGVNLIEGAGVTLTVTDDSGNEEVDVEIATSGGGAATISVKEGGGSATTGVGTLDFGAGFDLTPGAETDIALDLSEIVSGDVTAAGNVVTVTKGQGIDFPIPVGGDDGKVLQYEHSSTEYLLRSIGDLANTSGVLCAWAKDDISLLTTSGTNPNDELFAAWSKGANDRQDIVMPAEGQCDYISFTLNGDVGGVGEDLEIELWKNGSATGMLTTLAGGAGTEVEAYTTSGGPVAFVAGDNLTLYGKRTGSVGARRVQAVLWGKFTV